MEIRDPALFAELEDRAAKYRNREGRFWRISRAGVPPSFIVGSNHFGKIDGGSPYFQALDQARIFFAETIPRDDFVFYKGLETDNSLLVREKPTKLTSFLPADVAEKITQKWVARGEQLEVLDHVRPWFIYFKVRTHDCELDALKLENEGMDNTFKTYARDRGLEMRSAEVWLERLEALIALTEEPPYALLHEVTRDMQPVSTFEALALLDEERVMLLKEFLRHLTVEEAEPGFPAEEANAKRWEELIVKRNQAMLRNSISEFEVGGVFMVAGAMHLPTKDGLIALLEDKGFTATRMAIKAAQE